MFHFSSFFLFLSLSHTNILSFSLSLTHSLFLSLIKVWGCSKEECSERMDYFFESNYFKEEILPVPDAFQVLKELQNDFELHIVTARQHKVEQITRDWIHKHFPNIFTAIHFGNHYSKDGKSRSKPEMCQSIGALLLIDDSPVYAAQCAQANIPCILFGEYAW